MELSLDFSNLLSQQNGANGSWVVMGILVILGTLLLVGALVVRDN